MAVVTAMKGSIYGLGLYAAFSWLSEEAELVVMLSANLIAFLYSETKIKWCFSSGNSKRAMERNWCVGDEVEMRPSTLVEACQHGGRDCQLPP